MGSCGGRYRCVAVGRRCAPASSDDRRLRTGEKSADRSDGSGLVVPREGYELERSAIRRVGPSRAYLRDLPRLRRAEPEGRIAAADCRWMWPELRLEHPMEAVRTVL